jgi:methionyl aminopeptidase
MITRKSKNEIDTMRAAGKVVAEVHETCRKEARPGMSTLDLDQIAEEIVRSHGGIPTFKGYNGFPATICASVNEVVVHGTPIFQTAFCEDRFARAIAGPLRAYSPPPGLHVG